MSYKTANECLSPKEGSFQNKKRAVKEEENTIVNTTCQSKWQRCQHFGGYLWQYNACTSSRLVILCPLKQGKIKLSMNTILTRACQSNSDNI